MDKQHVKGAADQKIGDLKDDAREAERDEARDVDRDEQRRQDGS